MKRLKWLLMLACVVAGVSGVAAQGRPKLKSIKVFNSDGIRVDTTGAGQITVQLKFDRQMNPGVNPDVRLGLAPPYEFTFSIVDGWVVGDTLWQGTLNVNEDIPPADDGEYIFQISEAEDVSGTKMDPTLSTALGTSLFICRAGLLELSESSLDFGRIRLGSATTLPLTIRNSSCADLVISNIILPEPFSLFQVQRTFTVGPDREKIIQVQFRPTQRVDFSGTATIFSNSRTQGEHIVTLSGGGSGPQIQLSPATSLDFGRIETGESSLKSILVKNVAAVNPENSDTLRVNNILTTNPDFRVLTRRFVIPPNETRLVDVVFEPRQQRSYTEFITFGSDDLIRPVARVSLRADARDEIPPALSNLTPTWSGVDGFTGAEDLSVCWDEPGPESDINRLWWKFTPTPIPPQSPEDTTFAGGLQNIAAGTTCADLPLAGKLTSGLWYCYIWFENSRGGSGYQRAVALSFVYDLDAPGIPAVLERSIPAEVAFGFGETFSLTLEVPVDAERGVRDAADVRWKFRSQPVSADDYSSRLVFTTTEQTSRLLEIPFESASLAGADSLYIWMADSAGNVDENNTVVVPYHFLPVSNLMPTWPGFDGYTGSPDLQICWESPAADNGIAELWWKFSRRPVPPTSPSDTTSAGGFQAIADDATCASLPLLDRLSSGLWYCYVWGVDRSGNSGYEGAIQTSFVYDVSAPRTPVLQSRSIPALQWFGRGRTFSLTLQIPTDATRGIRDILEARWKFKAPPENAEDYAGKLVFNDNSESTKLLNIAFDSDELAGDDSLYVWLADSAGNSDSDNAAVFRYRYDTEPPEIQRLHATGFDIANLGTTFKDTIVINDLSGVDTAWVQYRFGGATAEEPPRPLTRIAGTSRFLLDIPGDGVTKRGLEYQVTARDLADNSALGPVSNEGCAAGGTWVPIRTRVRGAGDFRVDADGRPVALIAGEDSSSYQLFSVPYDLDRNDVLFVLGDDLGIYNIKQWRMFDYDTRMPEGQRYLEGVDARPFVPGRSYFILTRQEDIIVDSGSGISRRTVCKDTIRVHEGWNLIASPFNFPVDRAALSLVNSNTVLSLRSYERGWDIVDVMDPWKGYALFVTGSAGNQASDNGIYLVIDPVAAAGRVSKRTLPSMRHESGEWSVQISGLAGNLHDSDNWAGVRVAATSGYDESELAEPPVVGSFLKISFPHPEWRLPAAEFSSDYREAGTDNIWQFTVASNLSNSEVSLQFDFLGEFPDQDEVFLVDTDLRRSQDLRTSPRYTFATGQAGIRKEFKLMVGSEVFVTAEAGDVGLMPQNFELLANYPNPFNPETTIRYNLSGPGRARLDVFDLLGRHVVTLFDEANHAAGFHQVRWNGRDTRDRAASSGVYLYRLTTPKQSAVRKMILLK